VEEGLHAPSLIIKAITEGQRVRGFGGRLGGGRVSGGGDSAGPNCRQVYSSKSSGATHRHPMISTPPSTGALRGSLKQAPSPKTAALTTCARAGDTRPFQCCPRSLHSRAVTHNPRNSASIVCTPTAALYTYISAHTNTNTRCTRRWVW